MIFRVLFAGFVFLFQTYSEWFQFVYFIYKKCDATYWSLFKSSFLFKCYNHFLKKKHNLLNNSWTINRLYICQYTSIQKAGHKTVKLFCLVSYSLMYIYLVNSNSTAAVSIHCTCIYMNNVVNMKIQNWSCLLNMYFRKFVNHQKTLQKMTKVTNKFR